MPSHKVFYSWQSDLPNTTNRGFIEESLERAFKQLKADEELQLDPCIDRDTSGVPGSPDIAATIFEKIKAADIFVGDVTFIDEGDQRRTPNPNVLIELGFAASCLGWDRVICVFNEAFGELRDLPFDLRQRRIVSYELAESVEKGAVRQMLCNKLTSAIKGILDTKSQRAEREALRAEQDALWQQQEFLARLDNDLITLLIVGEEYEQLRVNPWLGYAHTHFETAAETLRQRALEDIATKLEVDSKLRAIADLLDKASQESRYMNRGANAQQIVQQAMEKTQNLKAQYVDVHGMSQDVRAELLSELKRIQRKLEDFASRAQAQADSGRLNKVQYAAERNGISILRIAYRCLDCIKPGLEKELQEIGHELTLIRTQMIYCDGGRSAKAIVEKIKRNSERLNAVLLGLGETIAH